jgi:SPP1 family predicted phage head-tail adaptor
MRIGLKSRRVVIERPIDSTDDLGDAITTYTAVATVWASVEPLRGEERFEAQQVTADVTHRIRFRWGSVIAGMTPKYRLRQADQVFDVLSVNDIMTAHRELEVYAKVRV